MTAPLPVLQRVRTARGLSRTELAKAVGCDPMTIARAEGASVGGVGLAMCRRIAAALEVPLSVLLEGDIMSELMRVRRSLLELVLQYRAVHYHGGGARRKKTGGEADGDAVQP